MNLNKRMPIWMMVVMDLLLTAAIILTFAYFHHVRMLRGNQPIEDPGISFGPKSESPKPETDPPATESDDPSLPPEVEHLTHEWVVSEKVEATCTEAGMTKFVCSCGAEKSGEMTPPLGHGDFKTENAREATDEVNGYTGDKYCGRCGTLIEPGSEIPAKGHENLVLRNQKDATCTEAGYSGDWYCPDCDEVVAAGVEIPATGHVHVVLQEKFDATCTVKGYSGDLVCLDCGTVVTKGSETPLAEHDYQKNKVVSPTCTQTGYTLYVCSGCGKEVRSDKTLALPHDYDESGKCRVCGRLNLDTSGDFGASFPEKFIQNSETVTLKDDRAIRNYASANGIPLYGSDEGTYTILYRSHDIFFTVREVRATLGGYYAKYCVYDVYVRNLENLFTVAKGAGSMPNLIADGEKEHGATVVAAVNGDYWSNKNHCRVAVRNGKLLWNKSDSDSYDSDICLIDYNGVMKTYSFKGLTFDTIAANSPYQVWDFGPALIDGSGNAITKYDDTAYDDNILANCHPRTAIGYYQPGHYSIVVVDARQNDDNGTYMIGCSMKTLAQFMVDLGCKVAYNLDGGDSTQAYACGEDIRLADRKGKEQRVISDIICIGEIQ